MANHQRAMAGPQPGSRPSGPALQGGLRLASRTPGVPTRSFSAIARGARRRRGPPATAASRPPKDGRMTVRECGLHLRSGLVAANSVVPTLMGIAVAVSGCRMGRHRRIRLRFRARHSSALLGRQAYAVSSSGNCRQHTPVADERRPESPRLLRSTRPLCSDGATATPRARKERPS